MTRRYSHDDTPQLPAPGHTSGGSLGVPCHQRCPIPRRHRWIFQGHVPPGIAVQGLQTVPWSRWERSSSGGMSDCHPRARGVGVTTEAPGSRRAPQKGERRAALGSVSAQPWCPWGSVVPQFPHLPRALCSGGGCLRASRWFWGPGPLCWGVGGLGGRMVLVMSPAPRTGGPCTQESSPGSSCRTKPLSHTPIWCCLPSANLGDTGGASDLPSQHPGPQG